MQKSTLFIPELEYALKCWEEANLLAENMFLLSMDKKWKMNEAFYKKPFIGSEVDNERILRRAVKNYKELRLHIEKKKDFDVIQFLPRVPKEFRETYTQINFLRESDVIPIALFPYFLNEWLRFKKVYAIYGSGSIPKIDPEKKNYLSLVPFDSFIIKFNEPFSFNIQNKETVKYNLIMVSLNRDEEVLDVLFMPSNIKEYLLGEKEKQALVRKDMRQISKLEYPEEELGFLGASIDICDGFRIKKIFNELNEKGEYDQIVYKYYKDRGDEDIRVLFLNVVGIINGFCKIVSELEPRKNISELDVNKEPNIQIPDEYEWNAVPITQIKNLKKLGCEIHISFGIGKGSEKSPHWRRGHWRRVDQNDGTIRKTWIDPTLVRKDKLGEEGLKGSATVIKDE